ncbi:MAG: hypothetical protein D6730_19885 [Bacteroidetes bacterium]|nr:MAG: hypothetical protein D6730_19885 [Bacteroidota bacterium]
MKKRCFIFRRVSKCKKLWITCSLFHFNPERTHLEPGDHVELHVSLEQNKSDVNGGKRQKSGLLLNIRPTEYLEPLDSEERAVDHLSVEIDTHKLQLGGTLHMKVLMRVRASMRNLRCLWLLCQPEKLVFPYFAYSSSR